MMFRGVKEIYEKLGCVNKVIYFDLLNSSKLKSLLFILTLFKKYDTSINVYPSNRREYNLISRIISARRRIGIKYIRQHISNFGFLNNLLAQENDSLHNVEENFALVEKCLDKPLKNIPPLQFCLEPDDLSFAENFLEDNSISGDDLIIGFHAGCNTLKNHEKRRWEVEKFAELAKKLIDRNRAKIFLFGGPEEKHLKDRITALTNSSNVIQVNTTNLIHTGVLMKRCNIFVTNDSSLMHVSAALALKTVAIIGPTNANYIHPWQTEYEIASLNLNCSPCFFYSPKPLTCSRTDNQFKCIKDLSVELVYQKVLEFIPSNNRL